MKKSQITGKRYYEEEDDYQVIVFPSGTKGYYHIVVDSAYDDDNEYFHLTKLQMATIERFKHIKV